jgi:hypothetical protein
MHSVAVLRIDHYSEQRCKVLYGIVNDGANNASQLFINRKLYISYGKAESFLLSPSPSVSSYPQAMMCSAVSGVQCSVMPWSMDRLILA